MTEREKQIEEIARDFDEIKTKSYTVAIGQSNMAYAYFVAREFAERGYRKIPDGAVVLTKEEAESKFFLEKGDLQKVLDSEREQARKETAREILDALEDEIILTGMYYVLVEFERAKEIKTDLLKKYGVEVEK